MSLRMMKMNELKTTTGEYEVVIYPERNYEYFEHVRLGDMKSGGLWFNKDKELFEFDGAYFLPLDVAKSIIALGYKCDWVEFCEA